MFTYHINYLRFSKINRTDKQTKNLYLFIEFFQTIFVFVFIHLCLFFSFRRVNDRIISVNGVSLENVEYATAVQVLRDSGNTVTLVVKRRVPNINMLNASNSHSHQHSNSLISSTGGVGGISVGGQSGSGQQQPIKVVLSKSNKKDDFGIVLGCRLFVKVSICSFYFS